MNTRQGESDKTWFRGDRFFHVGEQWYFSTREGFEIGPYNSQDEAHAGLEIYVEALEDRDITPLQASKLALQGIWASTHFQ